MTKHSKNENLLIHAYLLRQTEIQQEIIRRITVYWQRHKPISTQFSQKKTKNKTLKIIISFCGLTFFLIYLLHFTKKKKNYHTFIKHFEIMLSLSFYLACK